jgi:hypothetical protein
MARMFPLADSAAIHRLALRRRRGLCRLICDVLALPQDPTEDPNRPWDYPDDSPRRHGGHGENYQKGANP